MKSPQLSAQLPPKLFINGEWRIRDTLVTFDPATGKPLAEVPAGEERDIHHAVAAAKTALTGPWRQILPSERGRVLQRTAAIIRREAEQIAFVESLDSGKPLREARADVETSARYFEYYAGIADKLQGDTIPLGPDFLSYTLHEPVGVTAHIIPWNFPVVTTARGLAPALAADNTAVVKPAEETPLTALILSKLLAEAGLPPGVYNAVSGTGEEADASLASHPDVNHVTFTGSVETGKQVMKAAADHVASVTLELGGKSPVVVLADADLESALAGTMKAIFTNAGQVCSAGSRLILEGPIADFTTEALTAGRGIDDPQIAPLISPQRVAAYVTSARARGVNILTGGTPSKSRGSKAAGFTSRPCLRISIRLIRWYRRRCSAPCSPFRSPNPRLRLCISLTRRPRVSSRASTPGTSLARSSWPGISMPDRSSSTSISPAVSRHLSGGFGREKGLEALRNYIRVKTVTTRI